LNRKSIQPVRELFYLRKFITTLNNKLDKFKTHEIYKIKNVKENIKNLLNSLSADNAIACKSACIEWLSEFKNDLKAPVPAKKRNCFNFSGLKFFSSDKEKLLAIVEDAHAQLEKRMTPNNTQTKHTQNVR
jgi:hypothetical protein